MTFLAFVYGSLALILSSPLVDLSLTSVAVRPERLSVAATAWDAGLPRMWHRWRRFSTYCSMAWPARSRSNPFTPRTPLLVGIRARHGAYSPRWTYHPLLLATVAINASAEIIVTVHADFPSSGFASGPVFGTSGPVAFDVVFHVNEAAAVHYTAGFEAVPGAVVLAHDVYAFDRAAIAGSTFSFGNQTFSEPYLHNLSFALLAQGVISAPMFLSDITPGSTPFIEVGALNVFLGSYAFGPFVPGNLQTVSLTNGADVFDGVNQAFGTVRVSVAAVPIPPTLALLFGSVGAISRHCRRAKAT